MDSDTRIFVAGHRGLVGSAVVRKLQERGYKHLIVAKRQWLDLTNQTAVKEFFYWMRPQIVINAAAKVGGIGANSTYPYDFISQNLSIAHNLIETSRESKVNKFINLGSSCIYPKFARQPIQESELLSGPLEPTNEAYAIAKIAALKMCSHCNKQHGTCYLSAMPTNLYGIGDTYDLEKAHVLPSMIMKFHEAKVAGQEKVVLWGDGSPLREFLYADDLAEAIVLLVEEGTPDNPGDVVNIGSGQEVRISELAEIVSKAVGFEGSIVWDREKPNGTPRKVLDSSKIMDMCWKPRTSLDEGVAIAYKDFLSRYGK